MLIQMLSTRRSSDELMEVIANRIRYCLVSMITFQVGRVEFTANEMRIFMEEALYIEGVRNVPHLAYIPNRSGGYHER